MAKKKNKAQSSASKTASILKKIKRSLRKKPRTQAQKDAYLSGMAKSMDKNPTAPEIHFSNILIELNVEFETQKIVGGKIYDFFVPSKNMLIEADGNYFHAKDVHLFEMNAMQKKSVNNDKKKDVIARANGFLIERVWESDLKDNYEEVKLRFSELLLD